MNKVISLLASAPKRLVKIGPVLRIYLGEDVRGQIEKDIQAGLNQGHAVEENGTSRWYEFFAIRDATKSGSACYTWDKSGNRVKCEKYLYERTGKGAFTKTLLGTVWKDATDHV